MKWYGDNFWFLIWGRSAKRCKSGCAITAPCGALAQFRAAGGRIEGAYGEGGFYRISPVVEFDSAEERVVRVDRGEFVVERAEGEVGGSLRIRVKEGGEVVVVVPGADESGGVEARGRKADFGRKHECIFCFRSALCIAVTARRDDELGDTDRETGSEFAALPSGRPAEARDQG